MHGDDLMENIFRLFVHSDFHGFSTKCMDAQEWLGWQLTPVCLWTEPIAVVLSMFVPEKLIIYTY
jgi:hypothetical protein